MRTEIGVVAAYLLARDAADTPLLHRAEVAIAQLLLHRWGERAADVLLLCVEHIAHDLERLLQRDARVCQGHLRLPPRALLEAKRRGHLNLGQQRRDHGLRRPVEVGEEVRFEYFLPRARDVSRERVRQLDVEVLPPGSEAPKSCATGEPMLISETGALTRAVGSPMHGRREFVRSGDSGSGGLERVCWSATERVIRAEDGRSWHRSDISPLGHRGRTP